MAKWKVLPNGNVTIGKFNYTGPFVEIHGSYETHILGQAFPLLIATISEENRLTDPDNPRLQAAERARIKGGLDPNGQKRIKEYLGGKMKGAENARLAVGSESLKGSIESHGGQNETLWVCDKVVIEGNRRTGLLGDAVCLVYPNETTDEQIAAIIYQKHIGGELEWVSYCKAKEAHKCLTEHGWTFKDIKDRLNFKSEDAAKKYVHSFVWFEESGLKDTSHWSKFHHAIVPTLIHHFGYDPKELTFGERRPASKSSLLPDQVDKIAGCVTDFKWFTGLIKDNKLTDCRQSDGVVGPAIRDADKTYAPLVFKKLNAKPAVVVTVRGGVGKPAKSISPAQDALNYLKESRGDDVIVKRIELLTTEIDATLNSNTKLREYKTNTVENHRLRNSIQRLAMFLSVFEENFPNPEDFKKARKSS